MLWRVMIFTPPLSLYTCFANGDVLFRKTYSDIQKLLHIVIVAAIVSIKLLSKLSELNETFSDDGRMWLVGWVTGFGRRRTAARGVPSLRSRVTCTSGSRSTLANSRSSRKWRRKVASATARSVHET